MSKKSELDKYYTKDNVANLCIQYCKDFVEDFDKYIKVEPSAGNGVFLNKLSNCIGYDIEPEADNIKKQDWFTLVPHWDREHTIILGNPPFGKNSSLAKEFLRKAVKHAKYVAFILPRTFNKPLFRTLLGVEYGVLFTKELPLNSFTLDGNECPVPCVFQIWGEKEKDNVEYFDDILTFVDGNVIQEGNAFYRRAGGNAGKLVEDGAESSTERIQLLRDWDRRYKEREQVILECAKWTAGVKSLSLTELDFILRTNLTAEEMKMVKL